MNQEHTLNLTIDENKVPFVWGENVMNVLLDEKFTMERSFKSSLSLTLHFTDSNGSDLSKVT